MSADVAGRRRSRWPARLTVDQVEPVIPLVLGCHGLAIWAVGLAPTWTVPVFLLVVGMGLLGLLGWTTPVARTGRAVTVTGAALAMSLADAELVGSLLQWYYAVATVYPLVLGRRCAAVLGPLTGACYLVQVAAGSGMVPFEVAVLRAGVLSVLGLATWTAGMAYRSAVRQAEQGRRAAERAQQELEHSATHDDLTGLANRALLHQRLRAELGTGTPLVLLLLDLDRFKEVNDTLGHRYGDDLLRQVGTRLAAVVRPSETVARLGGDEFAVLVPGGTARCGVDLAQRMRQALQAPFRVEEALLAIDASIGIALSPDHAVDGDRLLQLADVAMYDAKASGRGHACYDPGVERQTSDRLALLAELRPAIAAGQLVLEYQPKVSTCTGRPVGMEALVRWEHPVRGRIMPDVFIPLAERSGVIEPLTGFVLDAALEQARAWRDAGLALTVAVNLSARNLEQDDLPEQVAAALHRHGVPPALLELEITESFLMSDPGRAAALLARLHALGLQLSLDDFGTGLSSLAYLKNLPVDALKIDRTFVTSMLADPRDALLVQGIVDLAAGLGLATVAEGVEDPSTLVHLARLGCTHAQGYGIARPMPAGAVAAWVLERRRPAVSQNV